MRRAEIEGFFNLLFAHLVSSFDIDSQELRTNVDGLLQTIISNPSEQTTVRLRV
jgi:translation initiation factor 3 subunit M